MILKGILGYPKPESGRSKNISLNNIDFAKLAQTIYKNNTSAHEWDSETSNIQYCRRF
jgi:hypothetical protein